MTLILFLQISLSMYMIFHYTYLICLILLCSPNELLNIFNIPVGNYEYQFENLWKILYWPYYLYPPNVQFRRISRRKKRAIIIF